MTSVVKIVTRSEIELIRRALDLLHKLVPDDEIRAVDLTPRRCPVLTFAKRYLIHDPVSDLTSQELWKFFAEVAATAELNAVTKSEFLRRLPGAMAAVFSVRKSHDIEREGQRVRGFRGVGLRVDAGPPSVVELEPEEV